MAENLGKESASTMVPSCFRGLPILLVDHDTTSLASLSSILQLFSYNVTSMEVGREALTMIDEQPKHFKLIIANIEMPDIDTESFLNSLFQKDIPLMLISWEMTTTKASEFLTRGASLCLEKPVSMADIKYLWQHTIDKKKNDMMINSNVMNNQLEESVNNHPGNIETTIKNPKKHYNNADLKICKKNAKKKCLEKNQIEDFRKMVRMQRTGQSSLVGKRLSIHDIPNYRNLEKRRILGNVTMKMATRNKKMEEKKKEEIRINDMLHMRKRSGVWTADLHMKFTAALCALGEKNATPKSILKIMNVSNLTQRQVASHLQKFKAQVQRLSETMPKTESKSNEKTFKYPSNYDYPFKASNLTQSLIASNSSWYALALKNSSSLYNKSVFPKHNGSFSLQKFNRIPSSSSTDKSTKGELEFCLGGKVNLNKLPLFAEMMKNKPSFQFSSASQDTTASVPLIGLDQSLSAPCDLTPSDASYNPCYVLETDTKQVSQIPYDHANHNSYYVPEVSPEHAGLVTSKENCYVPSEDEIPSISNYVLDIDFSDMGFDPYATTYDTSAYQTLSGEDYVPQIDVNQMDSVPCGESFLLPDNMVSCGESYHSLDNMMPHETCEHQMVFTPCEEIYVPDLEDMFPSDTNYLLESAMTPMHLAPNITPNFETQVEGSESQHQNLSDIENFLNGSDLNESIDDFYPMEEIQDLDEFLGIMSDKCIKANDAS